MRDLHRKRHEEFQKLFKEAVVYKNPRQATNPKIIREKERSRNEGNKVDRSHQILMNKLKQIVTRDSGNLYSKQRISYRSDRRDDSRTGGSYNFRK